MARLALGQGAPLDARAVSAVRSFYNFLDKQDILHNPTVTALRAPKLPHAVPKPLSVAETGELLDMAGTDNAEAWIAARDEAVLTLIYGCGLRIAEALGLNRSAAPFGPTLVVTGKGNKQRVLPVLPVVGEAVARYLALCPHPLTPDGPLFVGKKGGRLSPRIVQLLVRKLRPALGLPETATPHALRHSFATHLLAGGRRPARDPGTAGPRQPVDHPALYRCRHGPPARRLRRRPPEGEGLGRGGMRRFPGDRRKRRERARRHERRDHAQSPNYRRPGRWNRRDAVHGPGSAVYGADRLKESGSHSGTARWSYSGPGGPGTWGSLSPGYRTCSGGRMQSPIDLAGAFPAKGPALKFDYRATPLKVVTPGIPSQVNSTPGSTLTVAGQVYELLQFHFHAPSEHAIAGAGRRWKRISSTGMRPERWRWSALRSGKAGTTRRWPR